jgi:transposase InsO family protein
MKATSLQIRVTIQAHAQAGRTDRQISQGLHISIHTVRKWRRKLQAGRGLASRMGPKKQGALSHFPPAVGGALAGWRDAHPGWGPNTLLAELRRTERLAGLGLPSRAAIGRWLHQTGRARSYQPHTPLPAPCLSPTQAAHEEWEMDARGQEKVAGIGVVSLIQVNDLFSRVKLVSFPCLLGTQRAERRPTTEDYQLALRWAFSQWGLPDRLAVDHDSVFFDNRNPSPFPTRFHLWLIALGVELTFGRPGQPRDQAVTERSHQTWYQQVLQGQRFSSQEELWQALQARQIFLNQHLPCASLGDRPPLVAHPEASSPRRIYRPDFEEQLLQPERVTAYLARGTWYRRASSVGSIKLGQALYFLGPTWKNVEVEVSVDPTAQQVVCVSLDLEARLPLQGVSLPDLRGALGALVDLKGFQLALPFSWADWQQLQMAHFLSDTTK